MTASALFTKNTTDDDHHRAIKTQLQLQEDEHQKKPNKLIIAFIVTSIIIAVVTALTIAIFMLTDQRSGLRQCGVDEFVPLIGEKPGNSGAQAAVSIVKDPLTGKKYFLKAHRSKKIFKHERTIFSSLRFFGDSVTPSAICYTKRPQWGIVMELASGGDLYSNSWYHPDNPFRFQTVKQLTEAVAHLVASVASLHLRGYIHNDLRPNNVIFREQKLQVIDFGLSRQIGRVGAMTRCQFNSPPESFQQESRLRVISTALDWYTVGVLTHFIVAKSLYCMNRDSVLEEEACRAGLQEMFWPYRSYSIDPLTKEVIFEWLTPPVELPTAFKDFINLLICPDPEARDFSGPKLALLLKHDLFKQTNWSQINPKMYEIINSSSIETAK